MKKCEVRGEGDGEEGASIYSPYLHLPEALSRRQ